MLGEVLLVLFIYFVCAVAAVAGVAWLVIRRWRGKLVRVVTKVNLENGTDFVVSTTTVMGSWIGKALVFDQKNKILMFYTNGSYTLHDYSYIRSWNLHWTDSVGAAGNIMHKGVHLMIETNDLNRPVQSFPMTSKSQGDAWHQRLDLLLNG